MNYLFGGYASVIGLKPLEEYFGIYNDALKGISGIEKCREHETQQDIWALRLLDSLVRTTILKNAFYSTAQNLGLEAKHVEGWKYRIISNDAVLVDLWQEIGIPRDRAYLCFPQNPEIKAKQKAFLLCFVKTLEDILKK